jgi:hypothetical protein
MVPSSARRCYAWVEHPPPPQQPWAASAEPTSRWKRRWPEAMFGVRKVERRRLVSSVPQLGHAGDGASERTSSSKVSSQEGQAKS